MLIVGKPYRDDVRQACVAFADADCAELRLNVRYTVPGLEQHDHEKCHAAILKEVGLDETSD